MPKENEISLVVESDDSSSSELRLLGEQRCQHPSNSHSYFGIEVVQNKLRDMLSSDCMMPDRFLELNTGDFEDRQHALKMSDE